MKVKKVMPKQPKPKVRIEMAYEEALDLYMAIPYDSPERVAEFEAALSEVLDKFSPNER